MIGLRVTALAALLPLLTLSTGCGAYHLQGKAIEGPAPAVLLVDRNDPRLDEPGLSGASVSLTLDPDRLSAKRIGSETADVDGRFAIRVDEFGAGLLEEQARLDARLSGHRPVSQTFQLPGRNKRVLVVFTPGDDRGAPPGESFLEESLRMGEPYMR